MRVNITVRICIFQVARAVAHSLKDLDRAVDTREVMLITMGSVAFA